MDLTIIQTSDATQYAKMLDVTSLTVKEFAKRQSIQYESFIGLRRGCFEWQASYNRIGIIQDIACRKKSGWLMYMDADCYINDLNFGVEEYLADKQNFAFIFTKSGALPDLYWNVNNGVFFVNLWHPGARQILTAWEDSFLNISDVELLAAEAWGDVTDDQLLLQRVLSRHPAIEKEICFDSEKLIINSQVACFVRHVMRSGQLNFDARLTKISLAVEDVFARDNLAKFPSPLNNIKSFSSTEVVTALYETLLLRAPDPDGLRLSVAKHDAGLWKNLSEAIVSTLKCDEFASGHIRFFNHYIKNGSK